MKRALLLADDNADASRLLEAFLRDQYQHITKTFTAKETLAAMNSLLFDAVLLDLRFPDMPISEFVAAINAIPEKPPMVVLTGLDLPTLQALGFTPAGWKQVNVLTKPTSAHLILEALARANP